MILSRVVDEDAEHSEADHPDGGQHDGDELTSCVHGLRLGDDGPALGAGVGVLPEAREAVDQVAQDPGAEEAAEDGPHPARGGDLTGDLCRDLAEAAPAVHKLCHVVEHDSLPHVVDFSRYGHSVVQGSLVLLLLYLWRREVEGSRHHLVV